MFYRFARMLMKIIFIILFRPKVTGAHWIDDSEKGGFVICNHFSYRDPVFVAIATKQTLHFMAQSNLYKHKLLGAIFNWLGVFSINRESVDVKSIKTAIQFIKQGEYCAIFPEGTRSPSKELMEFKKGVSFLAIQCKATVVPAHIRPKMYRGRTIVDLGEPIDVAAYVEELKAIGFDKKQQIILVSEKLRNAVVELKEEQERRCK